MTRTQGISFLHFALAFGATASLLGQGVPGPPRAPRLRPVELLGRQDVQSELELLDGQVQAADAARGSTMKKRQELFEKFGDRFRKNDASAFEEARILMAKINDEEDNSLSFLLPHQRQRLAQLELQWRARSSVPFGVLALPEVSGALKLTPAQELAIKRSQEELTLEYFKRVEELREELEDRLLSNLSAEQRASFREQVGIPFEFRPESPKSR